MPGSYPISWEWPRGPAPQAFSSGQSWQLAQPGGRHGTWICPSMACQPGWASCPASPFPESCPAPREACQRALGRGKGSVRRGQERQTQTWPKGNRNSRTREGRNRDAGYSIIHGSIKDAQAPGLSAGFWPLNRGNSSTHSHSLLQQTIRSSFRVMGRGSWRGQQWEWRAGWRELLTPIGIHLLDHLVIFSPYFSYSFLTASTSIVIHTPFLRTGLHGL